MEEVNGMNCVLVSKDGIVFFYVDDIIFLFKQAKQHQIDNLLAKLQGRY
jgi:hypothetical protein